MTEIEIKDIRVGLKIKLNRDEQQYLEWGRVEAVGQDWIVVRADNDTVHMLTNSDYIEEMYTDVEDDCASGIFILLQDIGPIRCE